MEDKVDEIRLLASPLATKCIKTSAARRKEKVKK